MGMRKILPHDIRMQKNPQTKDFYGFLRVFMELYESKVKLAQPHGNFINGVANPEIVYTLLLFQILCIDWFFLKKTLSLNENSLNI